MPGGFAIVNGRSTCHLEAWRKQARKQAADDRFTVLFDELVKAYGDIDVIQGTADYFCGLRDAYVIVTGDAREVVERQVRDALDRQLTEELAVPASVPVPS